MSGTKAKSGSGSGPSDRAGWGGQDDVGEGDTVAGQQMYQDVIRTAPARIAEHAGAALRQMQGRAS